MRPIPLLAACVMVMAACADPSKVTSSSAAPTRPSFALAAGNNVSVVTESDVARQAENTLPTRSWVVYTRSGTTGTGTFTSGPGSPPLGSGSFRTSTPDGAAKVFIFNYDHVGTPLSTITGVSYSSYKTLGSTAPAFPAINIQVDIDGGSLGVGEFRTFVWEPYQQLGFVNTMFTWEHRDAFASGSGLWWSTSGGTTGVPTGGSRHCGQDTPCTWTALLAAFPGATITGGFGINQGSGNPGIDANVDALSIAYGGNSITYDFEATATSRADCTNGGWSGVRRADGTVFKNQGDCISYVENGK